MKRLAPVIALLLVISAQSGSLCAQGPADRAALIREIVNRSRLLEDAHFRVPRWVWQRFVVDEATGGTAPSGVSCIRSRGAYRLKIDAKGAGSITAEIHLLVFDARRTGALAVLPTSLAWSEIKLGAAPFKPATKGKWLVFQAAEPGHLVIRARAELKGFKAAGGTFTLPIIRTVQTAAALDSPRAFEVTAVGAPRMAVGSAEKGTHIVLPLKPTSKLVLNYRPLQRRTARQATYQISGAVAWNFGSAARQVSADLRIAILGGKSEGLEITLPAAAKRLEVSGPDVREVRTNGGDVSVFFRGAIGGRTNLRLNYELSAAKGAADLGRPEIRGGRWSGGTLVITNTAGGSEIQPAAMSGLKEIALGDIPRAASAILAGKAVLAYSIMSSQWSARAESMNLGEFAIKQTIADSARYQFAYRPDGTVICRADYEIRNRNRQFLRVTLPPGAKVLLARVSEKSRPMTPLPGKKGEYLLPLERSTASVMGLVSFPVQVVYMYRSGALRAGGAGAVALPRVDVPIAYAWCQAHMPGGMRRVRFSGVMRPVQQYSSETALASMTYGSATAVDPEMKRLGLPETKKTPPQVKGGGGGGVLGWLFSSKKTWDSGRMLVAEGTAATPDKPPESGVTVPAGGSYSLGGLGSLPAGSLSRNYWRAGQESYKQGKYDDASRSLSKVVEMFPKSPDAPNAKRLLANIKLLKGKLKVKSRAEKAAAVAVKQQISAANVADLKYQTKLVEGGQHAAKRGDIKRAQQMFEAAEVLGKKLVAKGENVIEQRARLRVAKQQLDIARKTSSERLDKGLKQLKQLRQSGQIDAAGELAERLAGDVDELANSGDSGVGFELQKEREQLAIASARAVLALKQAQRQGQGEGQGHADEEQPDSNMDGQAQPRRGVVMSDGGAIRQVYKVGDLVTALENFEDTSGLKDIARQEEVRGKRTSKLTEQVKSLLKDAKNGQVQITTYGGQRALVVTAAHGEQKAVSQLIAGFRQARGPQVQVGGNLALQEALNQQVDGGFIYEGEKLSGPGKRKLAQAAGLNRPQSVTGGTVISGEKPRGVKLDPDLQKFIDKNYAWQRRGGRPDASNSLAWRSASGETTKRDKTKPQPSGTVTAAGKLDEVELTRRLWFNRGQKTNVSSRNINVDAAAANSLGINFHKGNNDVSFTVVDEAQFRTLMEMDAAKKAVANGRQVDPNETRQDTIVGTDALLANSMTTNVTRSRDKGNTLDIADNPVYVAHEKYVLIDNSGYLTAVRAGEMHHWQEASKQVEFVAAPQEIEIPRVGELVKLEKTLVKPSDEMVVRFDYQWKGR